MWKINDTVTELPPPKINAVIFWTTQLKPNKVRLKIIKINAHFNEVKKTLRINTCALSADWKLNLVRVIKNIKAQSTPLTIRKRTHIMLVLYSTKLCPGLIPKSKKFNNPNVPISTVAIATAKISNIMTPTKANKIHIP